MRDSPISFPHDSRTISRGIAILGEEDGEVVIQEAGRIFRVSYEQAARRQERQQALRWTLTAVRYDPGALRDMLDMTDRPCCRC